jgi:nucleobase:cation symporter-1, NCS1 family
MTDEPLDPGTPEGPRRRTYEPPSEESVFTGSLPVVDDSLEEAEPPTPLNIPDPPIRTSLSESDILQTFQDPSAGSTGEMIAELERQVFLKEEEEEAFASWAQIVRHLRGEGAEPYIARQRIIFDGGDPGPLEELEDEVDTDEVDTDEVESDELEHDADVSAPTSLEEDLEPEDELAEDTDFEPDTAEADESRADEATEESAEEIVAEPEAESDTTDRWPLPQAESPDDVAPTPGFALSLPVVAASWWGVGLPVAAVIAGGYLSFRGLGILESVVVLGALALVTGVMVGVFSHQGFRRGHSTQDLLKGSFGTTGAIAPSLVIGLIQVATVTFLLWWASDLLVDIVSGAGLWPYDRVIGHIGAFAVLVAVTAALTLIGRRVLQGALVAGSGAAFIALLLLLVQGIPTLETSLDWSWSTPWMTVVSAGSLLLALATLGVVLSAADLTTLRASSASRAGGVLAAIALGLPFLALSVIASWMAQSSPVVSLGLLANPVGTLTEGAPAFYPALAIIAVVVPMVSVAALLTFSASQASSTLRIPGPSRVHTAVVIAVVTALGTLALVFALDFTDFVADLGLTLGVVAVTAGAIVAKEWAVLGPKKPAEAPPVRALSLVAFVLPVAVGLGLIESNVSWLAWQGYLFPLLEMAGLADLSPAAPGVVVAFVLAGIISGVGATVSWLRFRQSAQVDVS